MRQVFTEIVDTMAQRASSVPRETRVKLEHQVNDDDYALLSFMYVIYARSYTAAVEYVDFQRFQYVLMV